MNLISIIKTTQRRYSLLKTVDYVHCIKKRIEEQRILSFSYGYGRLEREICF